MNKKRFIKWLLIIVTMALVTTGCTKKQDEESQSGPEKTKLSKPVIKLAQRSWLGSQLNNEVARILLEEKMGYGVEIVNVEGTTQFESLEKGETHVNLEIWPSAYIDDIQHYINNKKTVKHGGNLGVVGKVGWYIPAYTAKKYPELLSWEGFKSPSMTALFSTSAAGGKGQFFAGDRTWARNDNEIIKNLGLNFQVVFADSEYAHITALEQAFSKHAPILFYFWTPHYLFAKLDMVEVNLPEYSSECYEKKDIGGIDCEYPPDILFKAFWPGLEHQSPEVYQFFKSFQYSSDDQIAMLAQFEIHRKTVEEAARFWIEMNKNIWRVWLP